MGSNRRRPRIYASVAAALMAWVCALPVGAQSIEPPPLEGHWHAEMDVRIDSRVLHVELDLSLDPVLCELDLSACGALFLSYPEGTFSPYDTGTCISGLTFVETSGDEYVYESSGCEGTLEGWRGLLHLRPLSGGSVALTRPDGLTLLFRRERGITPPSDTEGPPTSARGGAIGRANEIVPAAVGFLAFTALALVIMPRRRQRENSVAPWSAVRHRGVHDVSNL